MTHTKSGKRPWLGAILAFFLPGLGHVYLREWLRSLMWFGFVLSAVVLFVPIPDSAMAAAETGGVQAAWDAAMQTSQNLPMEAMLPILVVRVFSAIDAYWLALQGQTEEQEGERCPACGKPVDEELDFCQWCTTPLAEHENPDPAEKGLLSR
ncbi:zinc ribbon domain-containing protein [Halorussus halophilus]|uniref:zinc ribbon domain-containing protein n=1 Tax=Halorussus halophilus TaxID=2650975 RepID=UPI0013017300|nr:zinc ribbon domain-containing protein [Halorussus halophilus]